MVSSLKSSFDFLSAFESLMPEINKPGVGLNDEANTAPARPTSQHYSCSKCHRVYADEEKLKRHVNNTHNKVKKFECSICSKRFAYKHILQEHQNLHFGLKPHACLECGKRFAAKSNLIQHRRRHMKTQAGEVRKATDQRRSRASSLSFSCSVCAKT
jgi:uncharacterized Zn-finger protein